MTALQVYLEAFKSSARPPRSLEYKAGVLACLRARLEDCTSPPPYADGTTQSDAWFAGWDEGRAWARIEKNRRADAL